MTERRDHPDLPEAIAALREAIRREPGQGAFHYALAAVLAMEGNPVEATLHMEKARETGVDIQPLSDWIKNESQREAR